MPAWKGKIRFLAALAAVLAVGLGSLASSTVLAESHGRQSSQCVQCCNGLADLCKALCPTVCEAMNPGDTSGYEICTEACMAACAVDMQQCKKRCFPHDVPGIEP